jgi:YD repeat-containing protein
MHADPVNTASGAHVITLPVFKVNGAYSYDFNLRYNSILRKAGSLGNGWSHDFGAYLEFITDRRINVHWNANNHNPFFSTDGINFSTYNTAVVFDKLVKNTNGTYTLIKPNQEKFEFDAQGRLTAKTNTTGQKLDLVYAGDKLISVTDPVSNTIIQFSYNETGLINKIIDAGNREYNFSYDSNNNLIQIKNVSLDQTINCTYDGMNRILTGSRDGSTFFENTYDEQGRVVTQADGREI